MTVAIVGQTDIVPADISDFRAGSGLSVNNPTVVTVPGTTPLSVAEGSASNDLAETDLDLEWSGGVAPEASIVLVNSDNIFTSLQYVIQNAVNGITVPIISQSYGACEAGFQTSDLTTIEGWFQQANAQGQTVDVGVRRRRGSRLRRQQHNGGHICNAGPWRSITRVAALMSPMSVAPNSREMAPLRTRRPGLELIGAQTGRAAFPTISSLQRNRISLKWYGMTPRFRSPTGVAFPPAVVVRVRYGPNLPGRPA